MVNKHHHHQNKRMQLDNRMRNEQQVMNQIKQYGLKSPVRMKHNASGWPRTAVDGTPLRFIEDCRDRHKDKEIWVVACGPSLDDFPDNFFNPKEKIAIAVKIARVAFPDCTYFQDSFRGGLNRAFILNKRLNLLEKCIFLLPGGYQPDWPKGYNDKPTYQRTCHRQPPVNSVVRDVMERKIHGYIYPEYGSVVHYAILTAAILGAKKITLVGCEHRTVKGQKHAQKRGMSFFYKCFEDGKEYWFSAALMRGTKALAQAFKPYGIEIERYFYGQGYEAL